MAMPWQLAQGLAAKRALPRRSRPTEPRPLVELTPHIDIHDLCRQRAFPENYYERWTLEMPFKYPFVKNLVISRQNIEANYHSGYTQCIALHWCRTGFGRPRPVFVCDQCHCGARRLFFRYGRLACKDCHRIQYASRQHNTVTRKRLQAAKLRISLGSLSNINEPLPPKPKWQRCRTYRNITNQIQRLEAKAKRKQGFKKPIDTRIFAYHIS